MKNSASIVMFIMLDVVVLAAFVSLIIFVVRKFRERRAFERTFRPEYNMEIFRSKDIYKELKNDELKVINMSDDEDLSQKNDGNDLMRERLQAQQEKDPVDEQAPETNGSLTSYVNI
jgi:hypothetical protein